VFGARRVQLADPGIRVFENGLLRRIFGPKREKVIGGCRKFIMKGFVICTFT
jgi:hypothetical protein